MTNVTLLRQKIDDSGLKMSFIAEQLNMTPQGLYKKLKDGSDWLFSQVMIIKKLLQLSDEEVNIIFFNDDVE
jgi:DNA-binding phage protein